MKRNRHTFARGTSGLLCVAMASITMVRAEDITWSGTTGLWSDSTWNPRSPVGGDHTFIENGTVTIQSGITATSGALVVRNAGNLSMTGGSLDLNGGDYYGVHLGIGDYQSGPGTFTMTGGSVNANGGRIAIGFDQNSQGEATISGGTITHSNEFWIGQSGGSVGKLTLSGNAQISGTSWFAVGREGGNGELIVKDNAIVNKSNGGNFKIAGDSNSVGKVTLENSGKFAMAGGVMEIGVGDNTTGELTIKDSASVEVTGYWSIMGGNGNTATLNLDGGSLKTNWIGKNGGTTTINFNGGTVIAQESGTSFLSGFADSDVHVLAGGLKFDSGEFGITITQALGGEGSITKLGNGMLTLSGANTYAGNTTVSAGSLALLQNNVLSDTSTVTLADEFSLILDHGGTDVVGGLVIGGQAQPPGLYSFGSGSLQVVPPVADPYAAWALAKGLDGTPGKESGAQADPDQDGRSNLAEFAFNGNPLDAADQGRTYLMVADSDLPADPSTARELILTVAVRTGTPVFSGSPSLTAAVDGITYTIQGGQNLTSFLTTVHPVSPVVDLLPPAGTGYEYRSFTLDGSDGLAGKGFIRAKVEK